MTLIEKQKNFHVDLCELLKKYNAEITLEDFGREYMRDEKIVVAFGYDESLFEENGSGIVPDLVLGTYVS
mgnify:CR=1 FL=1